MASEKYRAIIIQDDKILVMKRNRLGRDYAVIPGGTLEEGETPEECCKRELREEFGIEVEPIRLIYKLEQNGIHQGFFVAKWVSGKIHKTDAEEYTTHNNALYGKFEPSIVPISSLRELDLVPHELREQLLADIEEYGPELNRPLIEFKCNWG